MNETYATVDIISDIIENTAAPPNRAGIIYRHFGWPWCWFFYIIIRPWIFENKWNKNFTKFAIEIKPW